MHRLLELSLIDSETCSGLNKLQNWTDVQNYIINDIELGFKKKNYINNIFYLVLYRVCTLHIYDSHVIEKKKTQFFLYKKKAPFKKNDKLYKIKSHKNKTYIQSKYPI